MSLTTLLEDVIIIGLIVFFIAFFFSKIREVLRKPKTDEEKKKEVKL